MNDFPSPRSEEYGSVTGRIDTPSGDFRPRFQLSQGPISSLLLFPVIRSDGSIPFAGTNYSGSSTPFRFDFQNPFKWYNLSAPNTTVNFTNPATFGKVSTSTGDEGTTANASGQGLMKYYVVVPLLMRSMGALRYS
jgi:hypothetical protein